MMDKQGQCTFGEGWHPLQVSGTEKTVKVCGWVFLGPSKGYQYSKDFKATTAPASTTAAKHPWVTKSRIRLLLQTSLSGPQFRTPPGGFMPDTQRSESEDVRCSTHEPTKNRGSIHGCSEFQNFNLQHHYDELGESCWERCRVDIVTYISFLSLTHQRFATTIDLTSLYGYSQFGHIQYVRFPHLHRAGCPSS